MIAIKIKNNLLRPMLAGLALSLFLGMFRTAVADVGQWTLTTVGDVSGAGTAAPELKAKGWGYPFTATAQWLNKGILFANLEGPVTRRGDPWPDKTYRFRMDPRFVTALAESGFDVVTLGNNHVLDYGYAGLMDTVEILAHNGIGYCGVGDNQLAAESPAVVTAPTGIKVAFVCFSNTFPVEFYASITRPGTAFGSEQTVARSVRLARTRADVVIASFHWGAELMTRPKDYQVKLAQTAVDAGAAAVIGHHPHVLQPVSFYHEVPVLYSTGNFAFGSYSHRVYDSALFQLHFSGKKVTGVSALPLDVFNPRVVFVPTPHTGSELQRVQNEMRIAAEEYGTEVSQDGAWLRFKPGNKGSPQ